MSMKLTRREFLLLGGKTAAGAMLLTACGVPERELILQSPAEAPEDVLHGDDSWYATTWPGDTNAEGVAVRVVQGRVKKLAGNPDHPLNQGRHSTQYDAGIQLLYHPDRITQPQFRNSVDAPFATISWDMAMELLRARVFNSNAVTTLITQPLSGSLRAVVDGFGGEFGNVRVRTFDPLEQGVLQNTISRLYGTSRLPHIDIASAHTVLSFGADWLTNWLSPVHYSRQYAEFRGGDTRGYLIHAEPRFSVTAASADRWLPVRPGYEGALALAIARVIIDDGLASDAEIADFMRFVPNGALNLYSVEDVAELARVSTDYIRQAAKKFATERPSVAFGGGSAGAHRNGSFNLNAIYALNTLVGNTNIRENPAVSSDAPSDTRHGTSYNTWQNEEIAQWRANERRSFNDAVVVRGVDIVHDMPASAQIENALANVQRTGGMVVTFANFMNDTAMRSNLVLPDTCFLEEWGTAEPDPGPGYPVVSFQQPISGTAPDANPATGPRSFGDVLLALMANGLDGNRTMQAVVRDTATNLQSANPGGSVQASTAPLFLEGVLRRGGWWNVSNSNAMSQSRFNLLNTNVEADLADAPSGNGEEFSLVPFQTVSFLNRLAPTAWAQQVPDPISTAAWTTWVEINAAQAARLNIREGDVLFIRSQHGEMQAVAYPNPATPEGVIGVPIGFGYENNGRYAENVGSNVMKVLVDAEDETTGAFAWAATRVRVSKRGNRAKLPKIEGDQVVRAAEPGVPVLVVAPGENAEDAEHRNEEEYRRSFDAGAPTESEEEGHGEE